MRAASLVTSLILITAAATFVVTSSPVPDDGSSEEALTWENHITVSHNGDVVWEGHNALTDQGKNWIRSQIGNVSATDRVGTRDTNASYIAIGNGSAGNSGLTNAIDGGALSGSNPAQGDITVFAAGEFKIVNEFTAGSDIGVVNTTSLNYGANVNDHVSVANFTTEANLLQDDTLTVTQNITIS